MTLGFTIAVEGIDNVGKTSLVNSLLKQILRKGRDAQIEPEFGSSELGQYIQSLVYENWHWVPSVAQPYIIAADRAHRYADAKNVTDNGGIVIFDRHLLSSVVYQGVALQKSNDAMWHELRSLYGSQFVQPDLTLVLDASVETAVLRGGDDVQTVEFLAQARTRFQSEIDSERVRLIDAERSLDEVFEAAWEAVSLELTQTH